MDERFEDLAGVVAAADHVHVVACWSFDPRPRRADTLLADVEDPVLLRSLAAALAVESPTGVSMMTPGDPALVFLAGGDALAVVQCLPGYLRCDALWTGDVRLVNSADLEKWLERVAPGRPRLQG